jgi:hypothetical protein
LDRLNIAEIIAIDGDAEPLAAVAPSVTKYFGLLG